MNTITKHIIEVDIPIVREYYRAISRDGMTDVELMNYWYTGVFTSEQAESIRYELQQREIAKSVKCGIRR